MRAKIKARVLPFSNVISEITHTHTHTHTQAFALDEKAPKWEWKVRLYVRTLS